MDVDVDVDQRPDEYPIGPVHLELRNNPMPSICIVAGSSIVVYMLRIHSISSDRVSVKSHHGAHRGK